MTVSLPDPHVKDFAGIQRNFDALRKQDVSVTAESINVDSEPYGGDLQAAVTAAGAASNGGRVFVPGGVRSLSAPVTIPNFVELYGIGQGSILRAAGNNYVLSFSPGNRSKVHDLTIDATTTQASGGGIDFSVAQFNIRLADIFLGNNLFVGLNVSPNATGGIYYLDRIRWNGVTGTGTGMIVGGGTGLVTDVYVRSMVATGSTAGSVGLWLSIPRNADTIKFSDCLWITGLLGVQVGTTAQCTNLSFTNSTVDGMTGVGVNVVNARSLKWLGGEVSTCGGTAGFIIGNSAKHVGLYSATVQNCGQDGVDVINGSLDSFVTNCDIYDNNQSNTASRFGIGVAANASDFSLVGNRIGNGRGITVAGHQKYGINVATGSSDHYVIANNVCRGNEISDTVVDGGTGTNKSVTGNIV